MGFVNAGGTGSTSNYMIMGGMYGYNAGSQTFNACGNGNFGVCTTSPAYTLDVNGTAHTSGVLTASSGIAVGGLNGTFLEGYYASNDRYGVYMSSGVIRLYTSSAYSSSGISLGQATGTGTFSDQLFINHSGQVGINTASPGLTLDINGKFGTTTNTSGAVPSFGVSGGLGDRLILYPGASSYHPFSLGVNSATLWYSAPAGCIHNWYINGTDSSKLES